MPATQPTAKKTTPNGYFTNFSFTHALMGGLMLASGFAVLRKIFEHTTPAVAEVAKPDMFIPVNYGLPTAVCEDFRIQQNSTDLDHVQTWLLGDKHNQNNMDKQQAKISHKTIACTQTLLTRYKQKKSVVIVEGALQNTEIDCKRLGITTEPIQDVSCIGFEPHEDYLTSVRAFFYQNLFRKYKKYFLMNIPFEKIEQSLINDEKPLQLMCENNVKKMKKLGDEDGLIKANYFTQALDEMIASRKELKSYGAVLEKSPHLLEVRSLTLLILQRDIDGLHSDINFDKIISQDPKQFYERLQSRNEAFINTVQTHCIEDTACIALIGRKHLRTHSVYQAPKEQVSKIELSGKFAAYAQYVIKKLEDYADKNSFAVLLPEEDLEEHLKLKNTNKM